jgi:chromate reductase
MVTIIIGTNRSGSFSRRLANIYCEALEGHGVSHQVLHLKNLPQDFIFSALYDKSGKDDAFNEVQKMVDGSTKFIFIVPEYNGSFPGVLKAFIDGLAFPTSFKGKVGALVGISSGTLGGALAMSHLTDVLNYLGMFVLPIKPRMTAIEEHFEDSILKNAFYHDLIRMQVDQLLSMNPE